MSCPPHFDLQPLEANDTVRHRAAALIAVRSHDRCGATIQFTVLSLASTDRQTTNAQIDGHRLGSSGLWLRGKSFRKMRAGEVTGRMKIRMTVYFLHVSDLRGVDPVYLVRRQIGAAMMQAKSAPEP
jgi:hypothetical protein